MEQLLEAFGVDVKLIVVQILNFTVLAVVLTHFLYKPVLKILSEREEQIKQGVKDAEEAAAARAAADESRKEILAAAHGEAEQVASRARAHAEEIGDTTVKQAEEKAASIVAAANVKSEQIAERARTESEAEIARLAVLTAEKVLREKTS
ncbi:MAG: F0F1 ATP synthase subunit B [Candidatus Paceibacterota bacterium]